MKSLSRVRLLATPWTAAYQAPPSTGFSRQEYWSGVPSPSPRVPLAVYFRYGCVYTSVPICPFIAPSLSLSTCALSSILCFCNSSFPLCFFGGSYGKESTCNEGDLSSIPGLGRSPGEGHGNLLQYSGLENPLDRRAWQAAVRRLQRIKHE